LAKTIDVDTIIGLWPAIVRQFDHEMAAPIWLIISRCHDIHMQHIRQTFL